MTTPSPYRPLAPRARPRARRRRARERREGVVLLIVLFVLMMASGTAVFAMHTTQFEQRAAGSLYQAMRTKFVAEGATIGVLSFCYQTSAAGCVDTKRAHGNFIDTLRDKYALPNWGELETVYQLGPADLAGAAFPKPDGLASAIVPPDSALAGGGAASRFAPDFVTLIEKWQVPNPGETRERYRLIVSTYGQLSFDNDATSTNRGDTESISATRAYFDVR